MNLFSKLDTTAVRILPVFQDIKTPARNMEIVVLDLRKQSIYSSIQSPDLTRTNQLVGDWLA